MRRLGIPSVSVLSPAAHFAPASLAAVTLVVAGLLSVGSTALAADQQAQAVAATTPVAGSEAGPAVGRRTIPGFVPATPRERKPPSYPSSMLDTYREGWVEMSLTVLADGRVTDVQVVDASDPDARFDEAALRAMTGWTYNPATLDGRPVDQRNMMLVLNFAMQDHPGVDKTIITAMKRIEKALDEGRLTEAEEGLRRLDDNRGMNLQAYSYLYMLWGRTMSRANSPMRRC